MKEKVLRATHEGDLKIGDTPIKCAVLEDGTRVLTRATFVKAIGRTGKVKGGREFDDEFRMPVFLTAKNLKPFIPKELLENSTPIIFRSKSGDSIGYRAELLPQTCYVFLDAEEQGVLNANQKHIAGVCKLLVRGFATVGISALVDEATGYQEVRVRDALQKILEKYLTEEWARWTKTFPDEFYEELFRVYGVPFDPENMKRPSYVGHWTNDIVYSRLAPKVLDRLRELNPKLPTGRRARAFHQHLTRDHGYQELQKHLHAVIALLKATRDGKRGNFERMLAQAFPEVNKTFELPLDE